MASAGRLTAYASRKTLQGQLIRAILRRVSVDKRLVSKLDEQILALGEMAAELEELRQEWEVLWQFRARRSEIHVALGYFASAHARIRIAVAWLEEQRKAIAAGDPVDAELDSYDASEHRTLWQTWPD